MTMRSGLHKILTALVLALLLPGLRAGAQQYTLASGDVIDVTVFRVPELSRQVSVDFSDHIAFPPLGRIDVSGLTLEEVGDEIRSMLAGREILLDADVTVGLVESRPVFVGGDVATPGAYPYRPNLSIRRAIALAGGLGSLRENRSDLAADLSGQRRTVANELRRLSANVTRLEAELGGEEEIDPEALEMLPATLSDLETTELGFNLAERREAKAHLESQKELLETRIGYLRDQLRFQEEALSIQREELDRVQQIQERGLTVQTRLNNERQSLTTLQERVADTQSELASVESQLSDSEFEIERFDARQQAELRTELQQALYDIAASRSELATVDARLAQLGYTDAAEYEIMLHRFEDGSETSRSIDEGTTLQPGDMVEVIVRTADVEGRTVGLAGSEEPAGSGENPE